MNLIGLDEAYEKWADDLVRYAAVLVAPADAPDVVADAFANLLGNPDGPWTRANDARQFLFGVVANTAKAHHRSAGRRARRNERAGALVTAQHGAPDSELVVENPAVDAGLAGLSVQQRAVTYLAYWEDMSVPTIAHTLGTTEGTVRKQLARARAHLRRVLS